MHKKFLALCVGVAALFQTAVVQRDTDIARAEFESGRCNFTSVETVRLNEQPFYQKIYRGRQRLISTISPNSTCVVDEHDGAVRDSFEDTIEFEKARHKLRALRVILSIVPFALRQNRLFALFPLLESSVFDQGGQCLAVPVTVFDKGHLFMTKGRLVLGRGLNRAYDWGSFCVLDGRGQARRLDFRWDMVAVVVTLFLWRWRQ